MYKTFSPLVKNASTNTVESSLPKLKTSKLTVFQKSKQKPCKNIYAFHFAEMSGFFLFKYETKTNYHSQNMPKCLCMHISYFG